MYFVICFKKSVYVIGGILYEKGNSTVNVVTKGCLRYHTTYDKCTKIEELRTERSCSF